MARSPDLATSPTEGLQPRPQRETYGPADGGVWRPAPNSRQLRRGKGSLLNSASLTPKEQAGNNFPEFSQSRTKLWQGLLTLPLRRPEVSNAGPSGRPAVRQTAGSGDPRRTAANWKSGGYSRPVPKPLASSVYMHVIETMSLSHGQYQ